MSVSKLKHKVFSKLNISSQVQPPSDPEIAQHTTAYSDSTGTTSSQLPSCPPKQKWMPWMPKEKYISLPADQSSSKEGIASVGKLSDEPSEQEKKLHGRLLMSDEEKERAAEERRKHVKEYPRNGRDAHGYMMGKVPKVL